MASIGSLKPLQNPNGILKPKMERWRLAANTSNIT